MEEHIFKLASYDHIYASNTTSIVSNTVAYDLGRFDLDELGLWTCIHSISAACPTSPSMTAWMETAPLEDGPWSIGAGTNSVAVTTSATVPTSFNLSRSNMPYVRMCFATRSATPSIFFSAYMFGQEY